MSGFRLGLGDQIVNSPYFSTTLARTDYLTAVDYRMMSAWITVAAAPR